MKTGALLVAWLSLGSGRGDAPAVPDSELTPVFVVDKSHNRNQVVYGLALDRDCAFRTETPVQVFWQMRERGEGQREGVLDSERPYIGLGPQTIVERRSDGGTVVVAILALPNRPLTFTARRVGRRCEAVATMAIHGREARLQHVFAKVWLLGVVSVTLEGRANGDAVIEKLR